MRSPGTILLIVPEFPPNNSIGGRRWAKFAKYLAKNGYKLKVIAFVPLTQSSNRNWMSDIQHENIEVFYLPSGYPKILMSSSSNIVVRIYKKIVSELIKKFDGGIIQDKGVFFKNTLHKKAIELIDEFGITNVICSGPSHRICYYTILLKKRYPDLNFIVDFRDRWLDGQVYGLTHVPPSVYKKENTYQYYICKHADHLTFTYQEVLNELKAAYPDTDPHKYVLLPHCFDLDDYPENVEIDPDKKKFRLVYGGTINTAAFTDAFTPFLYAIRELKEAIPEFYTQIDFQIFGENNHLSDLVSSLGISDVIQVQKQINESAFYSIAAQSDCLLLFLGDDWKDLFTTKSITYLPFKKPIVVVSETGAVGTFVESNHIGFHINTKDCFNNLTKLLQKWKEGRLIFDNKFDYQHYSFEKVTTQFMNLLVNEK